MVNKRSKPPDTLQDQRPSRMKSAPVVPDHVEDSGLPSIPSDVPDAPKGLLPGTLANWHVFWTSPLRPFLVGVDRLVIDRYFEYMDERDRAWTNYRRKKTGIGSTGQEQVSHWWKVVNDCERMCGVIEGQLGIGALNRMRLNISFNQAAESLADMLNAMNAGVKQSPADGPGEWIEMED